MGLPRRAEVGFDAEVQLQRATLKPATAASGKFGWLGQFDQPEDSAVESPRRRFAATGHGQLDVIHSAYGHCASPERSS